MKRTQLKDSARNIRKKIVSFLSLILIVFIGVMGYFGIYYMGRDLKATTEQFYQEQNFKDIIMTSSLGVGESEVEKIKEVEGVADAEGVTLLQARIQGRKGAAAGVTLLTATKRISLPMVLEGRLPEDSRSCALGNHIMSSLKLKIGDVVRLKVTDPLMPDCLREEEFTVVGRIVQPEYIRLSRTEIVMVSPEALDPAVTMDSFTRVYIKAELPEKTEFHSQAYLDRVAALIPELKDKTEDLGLTRLNSIKNRFLDSVEVLNLRLFSGLKERLKESTLDQLVELVAEDPAQLVPMLEEFIVRIRGGMAENLQMIYEGIPERLRKTIEEELQIKDRFPEGVTSGTILSLADRLEASLPMIRKVMTGTNWVILDNRSDEGYLDMGANIKACASISTAYGLMFSAVIMLVCFSTITIIISEQKKFIGATKAFGFYSREVFGKYLLFGEGAALLGVAGGVAAGSLLCRLVVNNYIKVYVLKDLVRYRPWWMILAAVLGMALLIALAVYIGCRSVLKSSAASLINGTDQLEKKKKTARQGAASRKRSLYSRLILRNMVSDLPRVLISIVIIGGSLMIMGVGFSLKFSTETMLKKQRTDVFLYENKISYESKASRERVEALKRQVQEAGYDLIEAAEEMHIFETESGQEATKLIVVPSQDFTRFMALKEPAGGTELLVPEEGVLIQLKMSEFYRLKKGDRILLRDGSLGEHETVVQGVFNNYQGRLMIMSFAGYRALFGSECRPNTIYTIPNAAGAKDDTIFQKLPSGFGLERSDSYLKRYSSLMNLYNAIVYLMIGMSVMLSFLVLTNLTNIFVSRKKKELIVMRVNGFNLKEAVGYLIRETVVTTAVGLIFGVAAGILIARMVTLMMEQPDVQLLRTPILKAWLYAAGLELLFALIIDWMAFRKVKTFSLSEIAES